MTAKKKIFLYKLPMIILALSIMYFALTPLPEFPKTIPMFDKIAHLGAFAVLALLGALPFGPGFGFLVPNALFQVAYGGLIELLQSNVPGRQADIVDFIADVIGVIIGSGIAVMIVRLKALKAKGKADCPR